MAPKYPEFEPWGDTFRRWMERADEPGCYIPRTTFTLGKLDPAVWHAVSSPEPLTEEWVGWANIFGLTVDDPASSRPIYRDQSVVKIKGEYTFWMGRIGPGVIFIDNIKRSQNPTNPYMSEFTKAIYESHFPLESLRCVIVSTVIQKETRPFIRDHIYKPREGLEYPPKEPQTWVSPSPEFCGILGTPIGKVVAAFILCAYGQGVKRIPRIVTFRTGIAEYNLRFDIEDV
ncbi:unnamed protein product [Penicillium egyptiacum]|uniref:Uncharacterized protein n=1 Tax=Penicillium egyptiacum TaxID=1303716 RepID=A0A9W4P1S5_9EURO|nr:unnamed protein product [Penicillium egyptiacum]